MNEQKSSITPILRAATKGWLRRSMVVLCGAQGNNTVVCWCVWIWACVFSACLDIRSVAIVCLHLQTANSAKDTHLSSSTPAPSWHCTIWALQSFLCQSHRSLCVFGDAITLLPTFLYTPYHSFFLCFPSPAHCMFTFLLSVPASQAAQTSRVRHRCLRSAYE